MRPRLTPLLQDRFAPNVMPWALKRGRAIRGAGRKEFDDGWWAYHGDERPTEPPINKGKELGDHI